MKLTDVNFMKKGYYGEDLDYSFSLCDQCLKNNIIIKSEDKYYVKEVTDSISMLNSCWGCGVKLDLDAYVRNFISGSSRESHSGIGRERVEILTISAIEKAIAVVLGSIAAIHVGGRIYEFDTANFRDLLDSNFGLKRDQVKSLSTGERINGLNIAKSASIFTLYMQDYKTNPKWPNTSMSIALDRYPQIQAFFDNNL
jgi:hypothetical protein